MEKREDRERRLTTLRDRFIAVSMHSRTLRINRPTSSGAIDLTRLHRIEPARWDALVEMLGQEEAPAVELCPVHAQDELGALAREIQIIHSSAMAERVELGADTLAIGWPILQGRAQDGTWLRAPLFIYPIKLERTQTGKLRWELSPDGAPTLNEALVQALVRLIGVKLTFESFLARDDDGKFAMDEETWHGLCDTLTGSSIRLETPDAKLGAPRALGAWTREDRDAWEKGLFALEHTLVLGRFPMASSNVVLDYQEILDGSLEDAALGAASHVVSVDEDAGWQPLEDKEDLASVDTEEVAARVDWRPFLSDTSQDAVARALAGEQPAGLVVQGPPGTGKSQMIANLLCDAVARGSRVLMVCQKRAALDVVAQRLAVLGVREALAVVHDVRSDRQSVCTALGRTLDNLLEANPVQSNARQSQLRNAAREHDRAANAKRAALVDAQQTWQIFAGDGLERPGLAELQELEDDDPRHPLPDLSAWAAEITLDNLSDASTRVERYALESQQLATPAPWSRRTDFANASDSDLNTIKEAMLRLHDLLETNAPLHEQGTMTPAESRENKPLWEKGAAVIELLEGMDEEALEDFSLFWIWSDGSESDGEWRVVMDRLQRAKRELRPAPWVLVLKRREELETWIAELTEYKLLEIKWWRFFSPAFWRLRKTPAAILDLLATSGFGDASDGMPVDLVGLCEAAIHWQEFIADLPEDSAFFDFGFQGNPDEIEDAIQSVRRFNRLVNQVHLLHDTLRERGEAYEQLPDVLMVDPVDLGTLPFFSALLADSKLSTLTTSAHAQVEELEPWMERSWRDDLESLIARGAFQDALRMVDPLAEATDALVIVARFDKQTSSEPPWFRHHLRHWRADETHTINAGEDLRLAAERAWRSAAHGGKEPRVLRAPLISPARREELISLVNRTRELAAASIMNRYKQRLQDLVSDPQQKRAVQKLSVQAKKQRYRLSLRQLVDQFWDSGLSTARPIWLCSPESVASMFPLKPGMFDLVVFDEASQCPVESSIGALVRARSVVIAGDDQQMPPSHFFQASNQDLDDEEAQDETLLASRSVLEVSRLALDSTTLRWHYRSEDEQLIAFSNQAFYAGKLYTAPRATRKEEEAEVTGICFEQLQGYWVDQTNQVEAERVVEWIAELLTAPNPPSIGVVTFNLKQAELILELVRQKTFEDPVFAAAYSKDRERPLVEQLFVRNLENVQGDERDVMLMSVGYGPSEPGGKLHARFGPLGMKGGGKRLNVAITRARRAYVVLTSFDPDELSVANTRHDGPKLFKVFLRYARAVSEGRQEELSACLTEARELAGGHGIAASTRAAFGKPVGQRTREAMATELRALGYEVEENIGLGNLHLDISVHHPAHQGARLGIDLMNYLSIPDPMTREVYLPRFWARMGWTILRVTPGMWRDEKQEVLDLIEHTIARK
ncbi:MAG: AAA domain-containing protein [Myxococcota bacterium]|nr:AAA domain-containing protein [Myxococcota bacterium]